MRTGWFYEGDNIYYLGGKDDGAMRRAGVCLEFEKDDSLRLGISPRNIRKQMRIHGGFSFRTTVRPNQNLPAIMKRRPFTEKFYFDRNGAMLTGWHAVKEKADSDDAQASAVSCIWAVRTTEPLQRDSGNSCLSIPVIPTTGQPS